MNYYNEIKNELINNEIYKRVKDYSKNKNDLTTYYNVGKLLSEAGKHYGERIIKEYSKKLTKELGKGYSTTNLKYMRKFYIIYKNSQPVADYLTWSHYTILLSIKNIAVINYYIEQIIKNNLSKRKLIEKIKNKEYQRLSEKTKEKIINNYEIKLPDLIKHPIIIKNNNNYEIISEKILKQLILEDIDNFLLELGEGFCYIKNEFKIKIGNTYNYIDLLLFNIKFNCYVVIELKVTELKKEHIGQIQIYMNYINENIKSIYQNKTIGIIIVKKEKKIIIEYSNDKRIYETTYKIN